jgi:N,N'-diacetylchitobiose non-reducing end deacetylase
VLPFPTTNDLVRARRILCIQPHYDDNDICAGGTLAALHAGGAELIYLTVTDDLAGVLDPGLSNEQAAHQLRAEQFAAGEIIGVSQQLWLGFLDAGNFDYFDLRRHVIRYIRLLKPDFVFTCDPWLPYEAHRDHIRTGAAVAEAAILYNLPRIYTDPQVDAAYLPYDLTGVAFYSTNSPNLTFDTLAYRDQKKGAIRCYQAQFSPHEMESLLAELDEMEDAASGEQFKLLAPRHLHLYPPAAG